MQCIISALKAESLPLIQQFNLEKDSRFSFPVFHKDGLWLLGCGVGKKHIQYRMTEFTNIVSDNKMQWINIGIAGGKKSTTFVGDAYLINKILDGKTQKYYFPDLLVKHPFEEKSITTVESPVVDGGETFGELVDMEASEIFKCFSKTGKTHRLAFIKIVSDYMDDNAQSLNRNDISHFIESNIERLKLFLAHFQKLGDLDAPILSTMDLDWVSSTSEKFSLTVTQRNQFAQIVKGFRLRHPNSQFPKIDLELPKSKKEQKFKYQKICEDLTT